MYVAEKDGKGKGDIQNWYVASAGLLPLEFPVEKVSQNMSRKILRIKSGKYLALITHTDSIITVLTS